MVVIPVNGGEDDYINWVKTRVTNDKFALNAEDTYKILHPEVE